MINYFANLLQTTVILFTICSVVQTSDAGVTKSICSRTGLNVLQLEYDQKAKNFSSIQKADLGKSNWSAQLKKIYQESEVAISQIDEQLEKKAHQLNFSIGKALKPYGFFIDYDNATERLRNKSMFVSVLTSLIHVYETDYSGWIDWFEGYKSMFVRKTSFMLTDQSQLGASYAAVLNHEKVGKKYDLELILSSSGNEPVPYLMTLIIHELRHAKSFEDRANLSGKKLAEFLIVDEAKAFNDQLLFYTQIAKKEPKSFCNFLYYSESFGGLLIPLSWTMASMESYLSDGRLIDRYLQTGFYKDYPSLSKNGRLRKDLQKKINDLKLKFVKYQ